MKYMLDTNICIYIIKQHPESVLKKFRSFEIGDICISSVTLAELAYGVSKSQHTKQNRIALNNFILPIEVMPFDDEAAFKYGEVRTHLEKNGKLIGPLDMMIAAHALSLHKHLITNNKKEFSRVPKLKVSNWV